MISIASIKSHGSIASSTSTTSSSPPSSVDKKITRILSKSRIKLHISINFEYSKDKRQRPEFPSGSGLYKVQGIFGLAETSDTHATASTDTHSVKKPSYLTLEQIERKFIRLTRDHFIESRAGP